MKNAKQTADAYEQTRSLLKNKLEPLFDEKNEKREAIRKVFNKPEEQEERRVRERAKIAKMNKEFREENKNLIAKYKELLNDNKENEKVFSEIYAAAQKLNPELKEEDVRTLIMGKKESQEIMKPQRLQRENHKIDKELLLREKLNKGRKKETVPAVINGVEKKITVIKKQIEGANADAFVWEYIDDKDMPKNIMVGEQLFNRNAVLNLGLNTKLPTWEQMQKIKGANPHDYFLEMNFQKDKKNLFPGYRGPLSKDFSAVGLQAHCWLADGSNVGVSRDIMNHSSSNPRFGFSIRLFQG